MNFSIWAPLKLVDSEFLKQVRLCYVFGRTGHEALMVTDDDEVYACGSNFGGCLGLPDAGPHSTISIIPDLCQKKIKGFSSCIYDNRIFVCAFTSSGQVYCWGSILITHSNVTVTPTLFTLFSNKKVVDLECGYNHCLALTADGEIYSWGYNDFGQLGHGTISTHGRREGSTRGNPSARGTDCDSPSLVQGLLKGKKVIKISCGTNFSAAILNNGEVYTWSSNSHGQLGESGVSTSMRSGPNRVSELKGEIIRKISCGASYVLAVSHDGELFSWGQNDKGQLGVGDCASDYVLFRTKELGKVIDIATISTGNTSAAMTEFFKVYMWGSCGELNINQPKLTQFKTLHEVFAYFGDPRVMYKPETRQSQWESINESLIYAFNNSETSDLAIVAEGKKIFVHKAILKMRSSYFRTMFQESWQKENATEIELNKKYNGMHAYLQYLYSGSLKANTETAVELLQIAEEFQDLKLKKICENLIQPGIKTENVADLYPLALKLNAKNLAEYCLTFATNHIEELIESRGFREWDKETLINFIIECKNRKMFIT